jgi:hypothetical protein
MNQELSNLSIKKLLLALANHHKIDVSNCYDEPENRLKGDKWQLNAIQPKSVKTYRNLTHRDIGSLRSICSQRGYYTTLIKGVMYVSDCKELLAQLKDDKKDRWNIRNLSAGNSIECAFNDANELRALNRIAFSSNCDVVKTSRETVDIYKRNDDEFHLNEKLIKENAILLGLRGVLRCHPKRHWNAGGSKKYLISPDGESILMDKILLESIY